MDNHTLAMHYYQHHVKILCMYAISVILLYTPHSDKQARAYGNLGWCYQVMNQYVQAVFCHKKVLHAPSLLRDKLRLYIILFNIVAVAVFPCITNEYPIIIPAVSGDSTHYWRQKNRVLHSL